MKYIIALIAITVLINIQLVNAISDADLNKMSNRICYIANISPINAV
jgi:hypothetical protein